MKKILELLRTINFFGTIINIVWCCIIVILSVFIDYTNLIFDIPIVMVVVIALIMLMLEIYLWERMMRCQKSLTAIWTYQIFNYFFPMIVCIIRLIFQDRFYGYSGFMQGIAAIGLFIVNIAIMAVAVIGCIIFNIVWKVKRKKRDEKETVNNRELTEQESSGLKSVDLLNVVSFIAIIIAIMALVIGWGISYGVESAKKAKYKKELSQNEEYRTEVLTALVKSDVYERAVWADADEGGSGLDDAEYEIKWEAYTYSMYVEMMSDKDVTKSDGSDSVGISTIESQVLVQGIKDYIDFTKNYKPERGVEMGNQNILYDSHDRTVSVSSELYCVNEAENATEHCCMVVVFDKDWKVIEIRCQAEPLIQYVPY